ncbi:MAG: tetratricopeptide repeat protein [Pseudomonadota bacterium]
MKYSLTCTGIALCVLLSGCSTAPVIETAEQPATLDLQTDVFGERPDIVSVSGIHTLTDDQQRDFQRYFTNARNKGTPPHRRVYDYLALETSNFDYQGRTSTASEALDSASGNCLSLAILTTALAKLANVEIDYQLIDSDPVFQASGGVIRRSRHVRSLLYDADSEVDQNATSFMFVRRARIAVDYFPSKTDRFIANIDEAEYFALYYQNIAADALEDGDLNRAYWLSMESLKFSELSPESLNMLAIVFDRAGHPGKSEEIYKYGIEHATRQVSLLRNYGKFLKRNGRLSEAEQVNKRLAALDDPNPFDWIFAGQEAYGNGNYHRAIRWFEKSAELAPYLHESHFGLARAHFRLGNMTQAEKALEQAIANAGQSSTRQLYEAKLHALSASNTR